MNEGFARLSLCLTNVGQKFSELLEKSEEYSYSKGKVITPNPDKLYFITKGTVQLTCTTASGLEWILLFLQQGCIFNEYGILNENSIMNYRCQSDVTVRGIPTSYIFSEEFSQNYPHLILVLLKVLTIKEAIYYSYVSDLAFASAKGRVCQALLSLLKDECEQQCIIPNISQAEIATMMGLHQTSLARVVKQLRQEGIIGSFTKKKLEIFSYEKLKSFGYTSLDMSDDCMDCSNETS